MAADLETGEQATDTLSLDDDISVLVVRAANKLTAHSSRVMRSRYGVGAIEWRMLVMLTLEPDIPASRATEAVGIDKAAVSRALASLHDRGLVAAVESARDPRRKTWRLTEAGAYLHDAILVWARHRDAAMLAGIPEADREAAKAVMRSVVRFFERSDAGS